MSEMKQCHACGEEIKPIAKRCPHCQTWQSKWRIEPSDPKWSILWLVIVIAICGIYYFRLVLFEEKFEDRKFQDYASSIVVAESKLHYDSSESGSFIAVLGKIKNESDISWENIYFEVQFYDSENNLIDTISDNDFSLVVLPDSESTFKVRDRTNKSREEYDSYKIIIKKASKVDKWF